VQNNLLVRRTCQSNLTHCFRYRYFGNWPNTQIYPNVGAWHGSEIPIIFGGTADLVPGNNDVPNEVAIRQVMQEAWSTFAKDPQNGLTNLDWPLYNPLGEIIPAKLPAGNGAFPFFLRSPKAKMNFLLSSPNSRQARVQQRAWRHFRLQRRIRFQLPDLRYSQSTFVKSLT